MSLSNSTSNVTQGPGCPTSGHPSQAGFAVLGSFYIVMTVVSFIGNVMVICTVFLNRRMHTVTNYLIINMALADLLLTVCNMPSTTVSFLIRPKSWISGGLGVALCKLIPFIQSLSVGCTVFNMTAIAIDRFFAVVFPLRRYITFTVAYVMIAVVWLSAIVISAPFLYAMNVIQPVENGRLYCVENWKLPNLSGTSAPQDFTVALFLFFYAIPLIVMSNLYSVIIYKLWIRKVPGQRSATNEQQAEKSKKKVLRMLLVVVLVFAVCWLPIYISQFIMFYGNPCGPPLPFLYTGLFLGHANSAFNPILYVIFNDNFRKGFKDILLCRCKKTRVGVTTIAVDNSCIDKNSVRLTTASPAASHLANRAYSDT